MTGPFAALGLPATVNLTDDEVRVAWRRAAAATHPDRPDGGDPAAFAAAAAAYAALRTASGRGEALAELAGTEPVPVRASLTARLLGGRPGRLAARLVIAATVGTLAVLTVGWTPAALAVITGVATWLAITYRDDRAARQPGR
ncbi:MAG: hypothetical protein ACLQFR_19660 [Streptosporangiaceae bacterium]